MNKSKTQNARARLPSWNVSTLAAATSLALSLGASLFFAFYPAMEGSVTITPIGNEIGQVKTHRATLLEEQGWQAVVALTIPVLLAALPFALRHSYYRRVSLWISAIGLVAFTVAGLLSIGLFYFPSTLAMCLAALCLPSGSQ
jgi:hypothetical protein